MANEIKVSVRLVFDKGGAKTSRSENISVTVSGNAFTHQVQEVGTGEEELEQGTDLGAPGYLLLKNLDSSNYVEVGSTTGVYDIRIRAGEVALYRHNSATIYAKATGGACDVEYLLIED